MSREEYICLKSLKCWDCMIQGRNGLRSHVHHTEPYAILHSSIWSAKNQATELDLEQVFDVAAVKSIAQPWRRSLRSRYTALR
jgi:hypothetical protein